MADLYNLVFQLEIIRNYLYVSETRTLTPTLSNTVLDMTLKITIGSKIQ
jgi:hypothetical protein